MAKRRSYVTVRHVFASGTVFEPGTVFPGAVKLTPKQIRALVDCGAIREPDAPPRPAPIPLPLGDEELEHGDAQYLSRNG